MQASMPFRKTNVHGQAVWMASDILGINMLQRQCRVFIFNWMESQKEYQNDVCHFGTNKVYQVFAKRN